MPQYLVIVIRMSKSFMKSSNNYDSKPDHYAVIMRDFNAKVGIKDGRETALGNYGVDLRSETGQALVDFADNHSFRIMNT